MSKNKNETQKTPAEIMRDGLIIAFAKHYRLVISERTRSVLKKKREIKDSLQINKNSKLSSPIKLISQGENIH